MARLTTRQQLIDYTKSQLGAPTINIEVTEDQLSEIIDDTIQKFTEYAYGTLEGAVIIQFTGAGDYAMPSAMTNLIKLSKGSTSNIANFSSNFGSGNVPDLWSEQFFSGSVTGIIPSVIAISTTKAVLDKFFGDDMYFNFNYQKNVLQLLENYTGGAVLHYQYEYTPDEAGDGIFNHEWVKAYTKAKTKELWSMVTGKFDQALVGGARINYDKMASEAERDIDRLHEELLTKWSDPAPIDIG